jgi:hypothetical protein
MELESSKRRSQKELEIVKVKATAAAQSETDKGSQSSKHCTSCALSISHTIGRATHMGSMWH